MKTDGNLVKIFIIKVVFGVALPIFVPNFLCFYI